MLIFWRIRYLDRKDRQFKDRDVFLDTTTLPPARRAAVELHLECWKGHSERDILKSRSLFNEGSLDTVPQGDRVSFRSISFPDYFEDDAGNEITLAEIGPILTGDPNTVMIPTGAQQHDIDFILAAKEPLPVDGVFLSSEEVRILGYFARDFEEFRTSPLMINGVGTLSGGGSFSEFPSEDCRHETAISDDEIRSSMSIFRRLYMTSEPAGFLRAVDVFEKALGGHALGKWVRGVANEYTLQLQSPPDSHPLIKSTLLSFTAKRLINVFVYTQYAHQPNAARQRQFNECLKELGGRPDVLAWLFLHEVWTCGIKIGNAGRHIAGWFTRYCEHHSITPDVLKSLRDEHSGLGVLEKNEDRKTRLLKESVEELASILWGEAGKPDGGPSQFHLRAAEQLRHALDGQDSE
jgi:hypothetical protein